MKAKSTRGASTRQRIFDAAIELVQRQGVNGTSVDDVLKASGTGKSQFYHYFSSKDGLVREVVQSLAERLPAFAKETLAALAEAESLQVVDAWLSRVGDEHAAGRYPHGCPIGTLAAEMASQNEAMRQQLADIFASWEDALEDAFLALKGRGALSSDTDAEALASFVVATLQGALLLAKTHGVADPVHRAIRQLRVYLRLHEPKGATDSGSKTAMRGFARSKPPRPLSFSP